MSKKFKQIAGTLTHFEPSAEDSVAAEDKLICHLHAAFEEMKNDDATIMANLNCVEIGVSYWTAVCCLNSKIHMDDAISAIRIAASQSQNFNLTSRARLIVHAWDNDREYFLRSI